MSTFKQLRLLIWKNFLLQRRHKWQTVFEILSPVLFCLILILVRYKIKPELKPAREYPAFQPAKLVMNQSELMRTVSRQTNATIAYSPSGMLTGATVKKALETLIHSNVNGIWALLAMSAMPEPLGFSNASEMEKGLGNLKAMDSILAGIQFDDSMAGQHEWPDDIKVAIRFPAVMRTPMIEHPIRASWRTNLLYPVFPKPGPRDAEDPYGGFKPGYVHEVFLAIQHAISMAIIKAKSGKSEEVDALKIQMQRYPQPAYRQDDISQPLERFISMIILLCFTYSAVNTVRTIAAEKELQLKETMRIMGLPSWIHWLAWFIKQFSYLFFSVIIMVILFKIKWISAEDDGNTGFSILTYTSFSVLTVFLLLYVASSICFCFMISTFFMRANTAASFTALVWFMTYSFYMVTQVRYEEVPMSSKMLLSLASNSAMGYGFQMMIICEGTGKGLQWSNLLTPVAYKDPFHPGHVMFMLILDGLLYLLIALYVEKIHPGKFGVPLPWYFPFTKSYWRKPTQKAEVRSTTDTEYVESLLHVVHEEEPQGAHVGVNISNLTKIYKGKAKSVDRLNLRMYEGEITVLLGHNGAGKTTTISMLTGMIPPTSGTATIAGFDIVKNTEEARKSLGICPQHNVLFPDLTVEEHIKFYSKLKGVADFKINKEIHHFVTLLNLTEKRHALASVLSGGQQRRLSVGVAMCGGSRVVLLDEPTSGLDPAARRALWELLQKERRGRTIIMTTHFMDEADILGDRIAIMAGGVLQCVGSPFFLKKHYGIGYRLTVVKGPHCDVQLCTNTLRKYLADIKENSNIGSELSYILPSESSAVFPKMLKDLEDNTNKLGVQSFGLSVSTLEEVFMKAGAETRSDEKCEKSKKINGSNSSKRELENGKSYRLSVDDMNERSIKKVGGKQLILNHIQAMFLKLALSTARNRRQTLLQILFPIISICMTFYIMQSWKFLKELPAIELSLESGFDHTETILGRVGELEGIAAASWEKYKEYFTELNSSTMVLTDVDSMDVGSYYMNLTKQDLERVQYETLVGATFDGNTITAWFSNFGYHDVATSLVTVHNAILRALVPEATLTVVNQPLPYTLENHITMMSSGSSIGFQMALNLGFCLGFVTSFYIMFSVKERVSGAKLMQRVSGLKPIVMWGCALLFDCFCFFLVTAVVVGTLAIFREPTMATPQELGRIALMFMVYGFAFIPVHYLASYFFNAPATAYAKMGFFNVFTGVMPFFLVEILKIPYVGSQNLAHILDLTFSPFPLYSVSRGMKELSMASFAIQTCGELCKRVQQGDSRNCTSRSMCARFNMSICCIDDDPYFQWSEPGIGRYLVMMCVVGVVSIATLLFVEYEVYNKIFYRSEKCPPPQEDGSEDSDVTMEKQTVQQLVQQQELADHSLVCRELAKCYGEFVAVDRLSFAISPGECFGLLGINGAGKTTTFKMLTGDVRISVGDAWVKGYSIKSQLQDVHKNIGYCPQFDALFDNLTGRETMKIYCMLRGTPMNVGSAIAMDLTHRLGFTSHLDKKTYQYSGGNKRKLSTALALLGNAPLLYLDEPTTGMDPASKRLVWSVVLSAVQAGKSVLLTTHSMEECEALCSRLTVMVRGRLHCLGSLQHVKNKYSAGYTLTVKSKLTQKEASASRSRQEEQQKEESQSPVDTFITSNFAAASLVESYLGISTYYLPDSTLTWSHMFATMERAKSELGLEDYSITQTSLEQVFLRFTRQHNIVENDL